MENNDLKHIGVLGMKLGRRNAKSPSSSSSKGSRKFDPKSLTKNMGKRNRTKLKVAIIGNAKKFCEQSPLMKKSIKVFLPINRS